MRDAQMDAMRGMVSPMASKRVLRESHRDTKEKMRKMRKLRKTAKDDPVKAHENTTTTVSNTNQPFRTNARPKFMA